MANGAVDSEQAQTGSIGLNRELTHPPIGGKNRENLGNLHLAEIGQTTGFENGFISNSISHKSFSGFDMLQRH